ncbi:toxic anion resistance protein [Methylicorpusculum oleiharenae]|uniref:toxic anion resistance protein n=1 Tax=Methylicorpusculum oleiharenae TaxID=1338687 RepID=UPI001357410D|nr:toxic anion resistance protein [Methylicorpusculum oleiharenae]MCD2450318.1 toxic anion resistance protein [Methylicorpusculum oleiharenae]
MSEQQNQVTTSAPVQIDEGQKTPAQELVPGVQAGIVSFQEAPVEKQQKISLLLQEIDIKDTHSILFFGSKAQEQLTTVSDRMLEGVKNKDTGPAGEDLNAMVATIRGFEIDDLDPNKKQGFFSKLMGKAKPVVKFVQQYEEVRKQIDSITDKLEKHKTSLLTDIASLDRLYQANLDYFHSLEDYIAAGEEKLRELDNIIIPEQAKLAESSQEVIASQNLRDLRSIRDDLERRVHDLRLTRQVSMQSLPSIRLVQENDKGLVNKINSTIVNTIPLWRQQLATAVTIFRSSQAAETVKAATDLTNDLLAANAENLKQANAETRKQLERGVFDIEVVKQANQALIATIEESLQIADMGKKMRSEAVVQLQQCEAELRKTLASAQASPSAKV